jgi:hypothetical protein
LLKYSPECRVILGNQYAHGHEGTSEPCS